VCKAGILGVQQFWSENDLSFIPGISCTRVELSDWELLGLKLGKKVLDTFLGLIEFPEA